MNDHTPAREKLSNARQDVSSAVVASELAAAQAGVGTLVLQWLAYAFWGWFSIAMGWLAAVVFTYTVTKDAGVDWATILAYPLAAVIILFVFALITDALYARREPMKKSGAAKVIMLLHVVPFVLVSIGALITAVFCLISMILNNNSPEVGDSSLIVLYTALVTVTLFVMLAARVLFGCACKLVRIVLWAVTGIGLLVFLIIALTGPAAEAQRTRDDRLIESALPSLTADIRDYAQQKDALPAKLTDVTHDTTDTSAQVQRMINQNLVTYKPNSLPSDMGNTMMPNSQTSTRESYEYTDGASSKKFYYQLCVDYKAEKKSKYNYTSGRKSMSTDGSVGVAADYSEYVDSITSHAKGNVCYNLYATGKNTSLY